MLTGGEASKAAFAGGERRVASAVVESGSRHCCDVVETMGGSVSMVLASSTGSMLVSVLGSGTVAGVGEAWRSSGVVEGTSESAQSESGGSVDDRVSEMSPSFKIV